MENITAGPVRFTEGAVREIKRLMEEPGFDSTQRLRVGVKGGGCSGLTYILGFDDPTPQDDTFETDGISCLINKAHALYLAGMQIDWKNGLDARGFVFINPNASNTCGCGSSFSI